MEDQAISTIQAEPESFQRIKQRKIYEQSYGNLGKLNTCRLLADSIGENLLFDIVSPFFDLLEGSVAIYEKNGDYVFGIFASGWCRLLDQASRNLCNTDDNKEALRSGRWHCHESCWGAAKLAMETGRPVEKNCQGGIHLFAVPIRAGEKIAGSISFGYGNPPRSRERLRKIADKYGLGTDCLAMHACSSRNRPSLLIEITKRYLCISARLIGEIVKCRLTEEALYNAELKYRDIAANIPGVVFQLVVARDGSISLPFITEAFCIMSGLKAGEIEADPLVLFDLIDPEDLSLIKASFAESVRTRQTCKTEFRLKAKTGEVKQLRAAAFPHLLPDGSTLWNGIILDTSEQKQDRETGKANHALAEKIVHDLNNILASMMGYSELIIDSVSEKNPALPHLHAILKTIQQARDLLRQALVCNVQKGQDQEPGKQKARLSDPPPRGEESILLVDDEEPVVFVGQQMLVHLGYKVFSRTSSLEALETFRAQPQKFDLVIVDQAMPNMTGTELARELIAIRPDIPIILCTGFHENATRRRIKDLGIRDMIIKPIDMQEIAQTIRTVLSERG